MAKHTTETSQFTLPAEGHYDCVTIEKVVKKMIKDIYPAYDWSFSTVQDGEVLTFKVLLFPSSMGELLTALGAKEIGKNKYEWDDEAVIGENIEFNLSHKADKSGVLRVVLSDVNKAGQNVNPCGVKSPDEIAWSE
jgi:hypothetical protein